MEESGEKVRKGIKRGYKVVGIVVLVLVVLFVGLNLFRDSELENRYAQIRAEGYPVTLEELSVWHSIPDGEENAADKYVAAFEMYVSPKNLKELYFYGISDLPKPGEKLSAETIGLIKEHLGQNKETLELIYEAGKIKHCLYSMDHLRGVSAVLSYLSENQQCSKLLCLKAILETENGKQSVVVEDIETAIAVARSREIEPMLISQLVRNACLSRTVMAVEYAVNRIEFSDEQLMRMIRHFTEAEKPDLILNAMAGERCQIIDYILNPTEHKTVSDLSPIVLHLYSASGMNKSGLLECLDYYDAIFSALRLPDHERVSAMELVDGKIGELPWFHTVVKEIYFSASGICMLDLRAIAYLRVGRVGLAVERYRLAEGKLPESLDQVARHFIDSIPLDPFDGKPIRYKRLENGFVVYSVGKDGVDNGGLERTKENRKKEHDVTFTVERAND